MKKGIRKFIAVIMVVLIASVYVPVTAFAATSNGNLGGNVKWSFDTKTRVITVSGSGDMKNFSKINNGQGFNKLVIGTTRYPDSYATKVVIGEGITNIGNFALAGLTAVTSVQLPSTVKSIGNSAFEGCTSLTSVNLTESITSIGASAFKNTKFANVNMPYSVKNIGANAFAGVSGLKITCNYGDAAYNYCVNHSSSYTLRQPSLVCDTSLDAASKQVKVILKIKDGSGFNAGNFDLTYSNEVTPSVSENYKDGGSDGISTSVVLHDKKISVAVMAGDCVAYSQCGANCSYTIAEFLFKINGQADKAEFTLSSSAALANNSRVTLASVNSSASLHNYIDSVSKAATCKETGVMSRSCSICGKTSTSEIPKDANNHAGGTEIRNAVAPTCSAEGYEGDTLCLDCGAVIAKGKAIAKAAHEYEEVITPSTCIKEGIKVTKCKNCGEIQSEEKLPLSDHKYDNGTVTAPTCTESGYTTYTCTVCGESYKDKETAATGHHYEAVVTPPTCTEAGYTTYTCPDCGDKYTGSRTLPLGHDYDETGKCKRCGDITVVSISFIDSSSLTANEEASVVLSKSTLTVSSLVSQIATSGWTVTAVDGNAVENDSDAKTGYIIKNEAAGKSYNLVIMGDINLDGQVTAADARAALRVSAKIDSSLTDVQLIAANCDGDDDIKASDARLILRVSAKIQQF